MPKINYLKQVLSKVKEIGTTKIYPPNTTIISEGERGDTIYFLLEGAVKVVIYTEEGRELILNTLNAINFFGEIGAFEECLRTANIISVNKCKVVIIDKNSFMDFIRKDNKTFFMLMLEMAKRLREANKKIYILSLSKAKERLQCYIRDKFIQSPDNETVFLPSHDVIAKEIGLTRETVTKMLGSMKRDGIITNTHGKVVVKRKLFLFCLQ